VAEAEKRPDSARYGTLARKLPGYLQVSGLGQTLAFLFAKGGDDDKKAEGLLLFQLGQHLKERGLMQRNRAPMEALVEMSPADYRQATREAMAIAEWLRRFAAGKLGEAKE
jgi:CRISPR-associated protein Cmr5